MRRAVAAAFLLALLPCASAGPVTAPAALETDVRLLHDCPGDYPAQAEQAGQAAPPAHDLVALDVREAYLDGLGDVLTFRFTLRGGQASATHPLLDDLTFSRAGIRDYRLQLRTSDGAGFTGDFDRIQGPVSLLDVDGLPDGRSWVEATIRREALGLAPGDDLSAIAVGSRSGDAAGDWMPGVPAAAAPAAGDGDGNGTAGGPPPGEPTCPQSGSRRVETYSVRGPGYYATLSASLSTVAPDATSFALRVRNDLQAAQNVTVKATAAAGVGVLLDGVGAPASVALGPKETKDLRVTVEAPAGTTATLGFEARTDLGGRTLLSLPLDLRIGEAADSEAQARDTAQESAEAEDGKGAPGPGILALAVLAVGAAAWRRR